MAKKTLYDIWQEHRDSGTCSKGLSDWCAFRAWFLKKSARLEDLSRLDELSEEAYEKVTAPKKPEKEPAPKSTPAAENEKGGK